MEDQRIIKTGNSAAVTVPAEFMKTLCLKIGDRAKAVMDFEKAEITFSFPNGRQLKLAAKK